MFDKLQAVVNRYEQIGEELTHPEVVSDNELFRKLGWIKTGDMQLEM